MIQAPVIWRRHSTYMLSADCMNCCHWPAMPIVFSVSVRIRLCCTTRGCDCLSPFLMQALRSAVCVEGHGWDLARPKLYNVLFHTQSSAGSAAYCAVVYPVISWHWRWQRCCWPCLQPFVSVRALPGRQVGAGTWLVCRAWSIHAWSSCMPKSFLFRRRVAKKTCIYVQTDRPTD